MKKELKVLIIVMLAALIAFSMTACNINIGGGGNSDDGDNGSSGNGDGSGGGGNITLGSSLIVTNVQLYDGGPGNWWHNIPISNPPSIGNSTKYDGDGSLHAEYTDLFNNPIIKVTNGKLTTNLGKPKELYPIARDFPGLNISNNSAEYIFTEEDGFPLFWTNSSGVIPLSQAGDKFMMFFYVDRAVTINGTDSGITYNNISLNAGWNALIFNISSNIVTKATSTDLSNFIWVIYGTPIASGELIKSEVPNNLLGNWKGNDDFYLLLTSDQMIFTQKYCPRRRYPYIIKS